MKSTMIDTTIIAGLCRPSVRAGKAAALLEVDISTIYKMVRTGSLNAHRVGKRGIRIFADSLNDYQTRQTISAMGKRQMKSAEVSPPVQAGAPHINTQ